MPIISASLKPIALLFKPCSDTAGGVASLLSPVPSTSTPFPGGWIAQSHSYTPSSVSSPTTAGDGSLLIQFLQRVRENNRVPVHLRLRCRRRHQGHVVERRDEHPAVERVQVK